MAYTNNNGQTRVGVRIVPLSVVIPTISTLLDSYSGASAAYSLRKLKSSYTGSAIRVRRSSDNTELNIGFDSVGNLDTYALSSFVGTGNGFVTTWYDQSGNSINVAQTTAVNQPQIVSTGSLILENGKVSVNFDGVNHKMYSSTLTNWTNQGFSTYVVSKSGGLNSNGRAVFAITNGNNSTNGYLHLLYRNNITNNFRAFYSVDGNTSQIQIQYPINTFPTTQNLISVTRPASGNIVFNLNNTTQSTITANTLGTLSGNFILGNYYTQNSETTTYSHQGTISEVIVYPNSQESNTNGINTNINTYYSVYPNPTSVWNLLTAVYSADTTALPSLKTSLVASYNGESNANDSFGSNNGTAMGGVTYVTGKIGNAFVGNGSNGYVSLPNNSLNFTGSFSISFWVKMNNVANTYDIFVTNLNSVGSAYGYGFLVYREFTNWAFQINGGDKLIIYRHSSGSLNNNQWYHVAVCKSSTSTNMYINGTLVSTTKATAGPVPTPVETFNPTYTSTQPCSIVGAPGTGFLNGTMDAVNFWQKELTQSEITELYNSGNGAQYIGDNFYKPTVNDALGTNNGTAVGGLTYGLGKVGTAFQFNGTNASVRFPANSMNFTGDFSISGWVNLSSVYNGTYEATLIVNVTAPSWFTNPKGFWVRIAGNSVNFDIWNGTTGVGCNWDDSTGSIVKANSGWIHIVATRKSSTGSKLYVNGVLKASNTSTINPTYDPVYQTPNMGSRYILNSSGSVVNSSVFAPDGTKMDGLSVWQKELTQSEITELYNSGNGKQYPN